MAVDSAKAALESGYTDFMISMPTGSGKTRVACAILSQTQGRVLFLTHRIQLVEQAAAAIRTYIGSDEGIGIVQGNRREADKPIVVASVQTAGSVLAQLGRFRLAIVDEAHHVPARTYRTLIETLPADVVMGMTATPMRGDGIWAPRLCGPMVYYISPLDLVEQGYLCDLLDCPMDDLSPEYLAQVGQVAAADAQHTVIFNRTIEEAEQTATLLVEAGVSANAIHSKMHPGDREGILRDFSHRWTKVLCNVDYLGEGIDIPSISLVLVARSVASSSWMSQAAGRAMRTSPTKDAATIWRYEGPQSGCIHTADALTIRPVFWLEHLMRNGLTVKQAITTHYQGTVGARLREQERTELFQWMNFHPMALSHFQIEVPSQCSTISSESTMN